MGHQESPQKLGDADSMRGPGYDTTVKMDWRRGGGKGQAEGMPHFDHTGKKGGK
jgi:hypothetical protein